MLPYPPLLKVALAPKVTTKNVQNCALNRIPDDHL